MFTKAFFVAAGERAVKTFAQALGALLVGSATGVIGTDWLDAVNIAGMAAVLSALTSVASGGFGEKGSPSLGPEVLAPKVEAVVDPASPTGASAGKGSDIPEDAPVTVEPYSGDPKSAAAYYGKDGERGH